MIADRLIELIVTGNRYVRRPTSDNGQPQRLPWFLMLAVALIASSGTPLTGHADDNDPSAAELFERRIMPIFRSTKPSSCVECHLSSVDLKDYILPDHKATFAALRDAELIDLDSPQQSRILELIRMGMNDEYKVNADGPRIPNEIREMELQAFTDWIEACCDDDSLRAIPAPETSDAIGPERPNEVIRHNRLDRITDAFERNIWSLRFRCASCHMEGGYNFDNFIAEHGEKMAWLKKEGPRATVEYLIDSDLIDIDYPEESMLLLKPLNEVKHGGGIKMARRDTDYMTFLTWLEDYSRSYLDQYETADSLPDTTRRRGSEVFLRVEGLPEDANGMTGLLAVHSATDTSGWSENPVAVASVNIRQNPRFGTFAQGFLLFETPEEDPDFHLQRGRYQVRFFVDNKRDTTIHDIDAAFASATEVVRLPTRSAWQPGFKNTTVVKVPEDMTVRLPVSSTIAAEIESTRQLCTVIHQAWQLMHLDTNVFVADIDGLTVNPFPDDSADSGKWQGPYLETEVLDAWGHRFELRVNRRPPRPVERDRFSDTVTVLVVHSPGPDGIFHTGDDVRDVRQR